MSRTLVKRKNTNLTWGQKPEENTKNMKFDGFSFKLVTNYTWVGPGSYDDQEEGYYEKLLWVE